MHGVISCLQHITDILHILRFQKRNEKCIEDLDGLAVRRVDTSHVAYLIVQDIAHNSSNSSLGWDGFLSPSQICYIIALLLLLWLICFVSNNLYGSCFKHTRAALLCFMLVLQCVTQSKNAPKCHWVYHISASLDAYCRVVINLFLSRIVIQNCNKSFESPELW